MFESIIKKIVHEYIQNNLHVKVMVDNDHIKMSLNAPLAPNTKKYYNYSFVITPHSVIDGMTTFCAITGLLNSDRSSYKSYKKDAYDYFCHSLADFAETPNILVRKFKNMEELKFEFEKILNTEEYSLFLAKLLLEHTNASLII